VSSKISDQTSETRTQRSGTASSIGAQLRSARESQNVTLRQISEQTRIQMRYLEAIESDNFQDLPGGIFNRSFIKAYARQIGYNEDEALEAYNRTAREQGTPSDEEMPTSYQPRVYTNGDSTRSPWVNLLFAALIVGIISIGAYALQSWYNRNFGTTPSPITNVANAPAPVVPEPTPSVAPQGLTVQIKAVREPVWLSVQADDATPSRFEMKPSDVAREYTPQSRLKLEYARTKASALEVTINGRRANVPAEGLMITPDSYQQLLQ
jgi:cytoskeletal protein RodZ